MANFNYTPSITFTMDTLKENRNEIIATILRDYDNDALKPIMTKMVEMVNEENDTFNDIYEFVCEAVNELFNDGVYLLAVKASNRLYDMQQRGRMNQAKAL